MQQSELVRHELPWSAQHFPPTQSVSPQQSSGASHAAPPGTAQQLPSSQNEPSAQRSPVSQHIAPTTPQLGVTPVSIRGPVSRVGSGRPESKVESASGVPAGPSQPGSTSSASKRERRSIAPAYQNAGVSLPLKLWPLRSFEGAGACAY